MQARESERRDWLIILLVILIGFLCVIVAGQWAVRFAPRWELDTSMGSKLDPNSDFLTGIPDGPIEPVDAALLTPPSWFDFFLTPGASFETFTPIPTDTITSTATVPPTSTATFVATSTSTPTLIVYSTATWPAPSTNTPTRVPAATATPTAVASTTPTPTATSTNTPTNTPTSTPTNTPTPTSTPAPVDLQITKTDGAATYRPGDTVIYTIVVTNNSPYFVNGAVVTDPFLPPISSGTWTCTPGSGASCTASGTGPINQSVNLPGGGSVTFTLNAKTDPSALSNLVNTASVTAPSSNTEIDPTNNSATDTDIPNVESDLAITVDDGVIAYEAGKSLTYTVIVSNSGPSDLKGAIITSTLPSPQVTSWNWVCTTQTKAIGCADSNASSFTNTLDIQSGGSVQYTVMVNVSTSSTGPLTISASVTSSIFDPTSGNNTASDTDEFISPFPAELDWGSTPGGPPYQGLNDGQELTFVLPKPIVVDGNTDIDLIYFEQLNMSGTGVAMDWVIIQIGNGTNWYTVLNWGDGISDANTNIAVPLAAGNSGGTCEGEPDNCLIDIALLPYGTGININVDIGSIPAGTYPYLKFIASVPGPGGDGGVNVDGIYVP